MLTPEKRVFNPCRYTHESIKVVDALMKYQHRHIDYIWDKADDELLALLHPAGVVASDIVGFRFTLGESDVADNDDG